MESGKLTAKESDPATESVSPTVSERIGMSVSIVSLSALSATGWKVGATTVVSTGFDSECRLSTVTIESAVTTPDIPVSPPHAGRENAPTDRAHSSTIAIIYS